MEPDLTIMVESRPPCAHCQMLAVYRVQVGQDVMSLCARHTYVKLAELGLAGVNWTLGILKTYQEVQP